MIALTDGVTVALVAFVGALTVTASPLILAAMTTRAAAKAKRQDWDRQDEVDRLRAVASAALLAATQQNATQLAIIRTNGETAVHLADGAYTALLRTQRIAVQSKVNSDELLLAYRSGTDHPPTDEDRRVIAAGHADIAALDAEIAAREQFAPDLTKETGK